MAATTCAALAVSVSPPLAKDLELVGRLNQPPLTLDRRLSSCRSISGTSATAARSSFPKSLEAKERNVYYSCLDGENGYPTDGGGDGG